MEGNKPEKKFKAGAVVATVWKNAAAKQDGSKAEFYTVSMERSYKDKSGKWGHTGSLRVNDLPKAVLALNKAYEYIVFKDLGLVGDAVEVEDIED